MALTKCKECGKDVSTTAKACPNCGAPDFLPDNAKKEQKKKGVLSGGDLSFKSGLIAVLIFVGILLVIVMIMQGTSGDNESTGSSIVKLKASVEFTGTQLVITNNDSFDWVNVKMEINAGLVRSGYALEHPIMKAGETYTVGALQFAKSNGTRFNPIGMKVQKFSIISRDSNNMPKGSWYGEWK